MRSVSTCTITGCDKKAVARGWCTTHYQRWRFHDDPDYDPKAKYEGYCEVKSCDRPKFQKGYCCSHYMRWWRHGDPLAGNASKKYSMNQRAEYRRQHYLKNKQTYLDRAKKQPKSKTNEYKKNWKKKNPAKVVHHGRLRKRRLQKATPKWLSKSHWKKMHGFYTEAQRLTIETGIEHHVDHIVPLSGKKVRGLHVPWNLRVLTAKANMRRKR